MKPLLLSILLMQFLAVGNSISAQSSPASFAYVLQADSLAKSKAEAVTRLAACGRDWLSARFAQSNPVARVFKHAGQTCFKRFF